MLSCPVAAKLAFLRRKSTEIADCYPEIGMVNALFSLQRPELGSIDRTGRRRDV
jgi:hypothetical protein